MTKFYALLKFVWYFTLTYLFLSFVFILINYTTV